MKILSEHALPFLFSSLAREGINKCDIVIVDDAIYYGTTVENLASEIKEYEKSYGIKVDLEIYTAIKAIWSKEIKEAEIWYNREQLARINFQREILDVNNQEDIERYIEEMGNI